MKDINIGIVNYLISNKLRDSYFESKLLKESKEIVYDFLEVIENSPILQLEFKVFNNIENKHISEDAVAVRYIDNNIKLFEIYTLDEINNEKNKLRRFINEDIDVENIDKYELYNSIDILIEQSLVDYNDVDVNLIHEAFTKVINYVKTPKTLKENISNDNEINIENINEDVIEIAISKFNEKYDSLDESDKNLLQTLIKSKVKEKKEILENYKTENLQILENMNKDGIKENVSNAINKIKNMTYNKNTIDNDIIDLYELKKDLIN